MAELQDSGLPLRDPSTEQPTDDDGIAAAVERFVESVELATPAAPQSILDLTDEGTTP
jgi:hypothetical protein